MAIGHVVTRGYGNGTLVGTIAFVATRGYVAGAEAEAVAAGYRKRRVYTETIRDERPERTERKPRFRDVSRPFDNNADEIIARATTELDSIAEPVLAVYDGLNQRRRDDEALMLIILLAE